MSTKAKRHVHKYHQVMMGSVPVWACALPDCNHYMPAHMKNMIPGKASICWECLSPITLDKHNMEFQTPICAKCERKHEHPEEFTEIKPEEPIVQTEPIIEEPQIITPELGADGLCIKCHKNPIAIGKICRACFDRI